MSYRPTELGTAQEIKANLEKIRDKLTNVSAGAAGRAQEDIASGSRAAQDATASLSYADRQKNAAGVWAFAGDARRATNMQIMASTNLIIIQRRTADLAKTLDSLVDEINADISLLSATNLPWVEAANECRRWIVSLEQAR